MAAGYKERQPVSICIDSEYSILLSVQFAADSINSCGSI